MDAGDVVDGRFRLVERVGAGGMGVVFRAFDQVGEEMVAIKLLAGRSATELERARREAEVLARLSHPAIVRHIADGFADDTMYVAMEWVDGITAAERIGRQGFSLREAMIVVRRVADALVAAHRAHILHRDLKPSNILLAHDDPAGAKLIDFGIARPRDAMIALTKPGNTVGTPGYMAPEQARGDRELTPATDVFGLGCVLYECATAKPAFSGTSAIAVMAKILLGAPDPLIASVGEAPRALVALLDRMLAKDAKKRLPDCAAVVAEIDALGTLPQGPRRTARRLTTEVTELNRPSTLHYAVAAQRLDADGAELPPDEAQVDALIAASRAWDARLEVLANGSVVAHVTGEGGNPANRAAHLALDLRRILPGWSIAVSSPADAVEQAVEGGAILLTRTTMSAIFETSDPDAIAIDPITAEQLVEEFDISTSRNGATLNGERRSG